MGGSSKALLDLETNNSNPSSNESSLFVCKSSEEDVMLMKIEAAKIKAFPYPSDTKPRIAPTQPSQVIGKLKDFLGIMAESNKKLQQDAMNSKNYDIEALTGDESEYIEMDLMLGVADLNTPEAVAAAESAIEGSQPVISLDASSSESESEEDSDDSCSDSNNDTNDKTKKVSAPMKSKCQTGDNKPKSAISESSQKRKRPKIVELL